jgi:glycosyltransferase involved in cell wall biosynthesis
MCNYNYGRYIGDAFEAILSQSYSPAEIIVLDDGSTDNSVAVIEEYAKKYVSIRFLKNEKNMGLNYSINRCLEASSGEYIYWAGSDDKVLPGFFEKSTNLLAQYPQAGLCCTE